MIMAGKKKQTTTSTKTKKKKWFSIQAPELFSKASLGESHLTESALLEGKYLTANLSTISGNMRKQNINIQFKVVKVVEGVGQTKVVGYSMLNAALKRLIRRGRDKITDSFLVKTKNKEIVRVKPLIITKSCGTKSIQTAIRLEARRVIREHSFSVTTEELFNDIVTAKLQKLIKENAQTFYPLRSVEIRMAKLEENSNITVTDKAIESEPVKRRIKDDEAKKHKPAEEEKNEEVTEESSVEEQTEENTEEAETSEEESEEFGEDESSDEDDSKKE